jgi:hypothetical protein
MNELFALSELVGNCMKGSEIGHGKAKRHVSTVPYIREGNKGGKESCFLVEKERKRNKKKEERKKSFLLSPVFI